MLLVGCDLLFPLVASLFSHGDGYAAWGCILVAYPVYLSEESAVEVLREHLEEAGYRGLSSGRSCSEYSTRRVWIRTSCGFIEEYQILDAQHYDRLDLCSPDGELGFEYVSLSDVEQILEEEEIEFCSVGGRDIKDAARYVSTELAASVRSRYVGMFYEPVNAYDTGLGPGESQEEGVRELLRAQAEDFLAWLDKRRYE